MGRNAIILAGLQGLANVISSCGPPGETKLVQRVGPVGLARTSSSFAEIIAPLASLARPF
jgi:hypothetical protein